MSKKINTKDIVTVTALVGLGYLLLTSGSGTPGSGGGSGGAKEGVTEIIADELGGLGVSTPNYTINIPGQGDSTLIFPDFPEPPGVTDIPSVDGKPDKPLEVPEFIKKFDILNELIGIRTEDFFPKVWEKKKDIINTPMPQMGTGTGLFSKLALGDVSFSLAKTFLGVIVPQKESVKGTGSVLTKKGRKGRVSAFREKYKIPVDYSYPVTGKSIKVT